MARDRQRSKRRSGNAGNPARSKARDMGLDDPTIDEAGLGDTTPAPDPLKNASAEVDQALAAETGAVRPGPGEVDITEDARGGDAPDEVENDLVPAARGTRAAPAERREAGNRVVVFLRNCVEELRRVQWPDRKHVFQATAVVLGFVLIAGGYLGLLDALWQPLVNKIL
jgi:preprotein translocase SecE subunit